MRSLIEYERKKEKKRVVFAKYEQEKSNKKR